jgi:GDP-4-dehydro-6-deoxy-D-mannose reductase
MRVLVTGANGFVGRHLIVAAQAAGHETIACGGPGEANALDVTDAAAVRSTLSEARPEAVIHLAGQAFVPPSISDPLTTLAINASGTANVLEGLRALKAGGAAVRALVVSSAEVYGKQRPERMPLDEHTPIRPENPYAASKAAAELYAQTWARVYGLDVIVVRAFNHIGPGQDARFVVPSFAHQVAAIAAGGPNLLMVGNLEAQRDFLDVRDVVAAYLALLANGRAGEVYNVCSGRAVAIREVLRQVIMLARVAVEIREDPARMRPSDVPLLVGDATKLRGETGWAPAYTLAASLRDIYADACERVAVGA